MTIANAGLAFNKTVFKDLNPDNRSEFRRKTFALHNALYRLELNPQVVAMLDVKNLLDLSPEGKDTHGRLLKQSPLTVAWPGLMVGLGYGHGAKTTTKDEKTNHPFETEVKTGFYFDFTTGLPVLPGSTVKGILRSFFPGRCKGIKELKATVNQRLKDILKTVFKKEFGDVQVKDLEEVIFEGQENGKSIPSTEQDIFFDAFPCAGITAKVFESNSPQPVQNAFLGEDVLTPHHHPLKDPVPLKHLKILPGVKMKFQFLLNDKGGLSAKEKETLFTHLLREFGAGARKGTGFGQFEPKEEEKKKKNPLEGNGYIAFDDPDPMGWEKDAESQKAGTRQESRSRGGHEKQRRDERPPEKLAGYGPQRVDKAKAETSSEDWPDVSSLTVKVDDFDGKVISVRANNIVVQPYLTGLPSSKTYKITLGRFDDSPYRPGQVVRLQLSQKQKLGNEWSVQLKFAK